MRHGHSRFTEAPSCRGRKSDTVDALRNPDTSQFLRNRIPRFTQTESNDVCQFRWKGSRKIKISIRRHREDIGHSWILPDTNQAATAQSILAGRHFTQRRLLFEARIDSSHTDWHEAAAVQPSPFATDHIVGMKIPECYRSEEIALQREVAPAITSASCLRAARPSFKPVHQPEGAEIRR